MQIVLSLLSLLSVCADGVNTKTIYLGMHNMCAFIKTSLSVEPCTLL